MLAGLGKGDLKGAVDALSGVTNGDLTGVIDTLDGITNAELVDSLGLAPVLQSVCSQVSSLTGGLDSVNKGVKGLGVLGLAGLSLSGLSALPTNLLSGYSCPAI